MKNLFFITLLLCIFAPSWAANSVLVKGLFNNKALLIIDGKQVMLRQGQIVNGVKLITATSREAVLEINGKRQRLGISKLVGGSYQETEKKTVRIASKGNGHHWVRGKVNGRSVDFLVDTGASHIALNVSTAKRLGVDFENGRRAYSNTANGVKEIRMVILDKVTIGEITVNNVRASVSLDDTLNISLLGNSFLSQTNMSIENGVMVLESK